MSFTTQLLGFIFLIILNAAAQRQPHEAKALGEECERDMSCKCEDLTVHNYDEKDSDLCNDNRFCEEYLNISRSPPRNIKVITVVNASVINNTIQYNSSYYTDNCEENGFDFASYRNRPGMSRLSANHTFAPWIYVINRHSSRNPKEILETQCLCNKCFNSERNGFNSRYIVYPLLVTRYFKMEGKGNEIFNAEFSVGCFCEYELQS